MNNNDAVLLFYPGGSASPITAANNLHNEFVVVKLGSNIIVLLLKRLDNDRLFILSVLLIGVIKTKRELVRYYDFIYCMKFSYTK